MASKKRKTLDTAESKASSSDPTKFPDMDPEVAKQLFDHGAFLLFLDFPEGSEFGIDYNSWNVGPKFRGLKMIPPGIHFICYGSISKEGSQAPRIGFFHDFKEREIVVRKWNKQTEDVKDPSLTAPDELDNYRSHIRDLDPYLGPYPYQTYRTWFSLTNHMTSRLLEALQPISGRITAQTELVTMESETLGSEYSRVDRAHPTRIRFADEQGLPIMRVKPGSEIRFHEIPSDRIPEGAQGIERTKHSMDCSYQLGQFLERNAITETELLGEMQFAFVCFLIGHIYESFEQWKRLIHLMCSCTTALVQRNDLYMQFLMMVHFQLKECPEDFFVDIVSRNNFLTITLSNLFANLESTEGVSEGLREKGRKFKAYLTKRFKWDFESEGDKPVVVTE